MDSERADAADLNDGGRIPGAAGPAGHGAARTGKSGKRSAAGAVTALQRSAGNRAAAIALQRSARALLDPASSDVEVADAGLEGDRIELPHRAEAETATGADLSQVTARSSPVATAVLGTPAYAHRGELVFADDSPPADVVAHEVTHLAQEGCVAGHTAVDPAAGEAAHEAEATAAGERAGAGDPAPAGGRQGRSPTGQPRNLSAAQRQAIMSTVASAVSPMLLILRLAGWDCTGVAVGLREGAAAGAGIGGGAGVDEMLFVDPVNWRITGDVVPYAEAGVAIRAGGSISLVVGLRLTPRGSAAGRDSRAAYEGSSLNLALRAMAGVGLYASTGLLQGQEGWCGFTVGLGGEGGASFTTSYGVSGVNAATAVSSSVQSTVRMLVDAAAGASAAAQGINRAIGSAVASLFAVFDPAQWDLTGYTAGEQTAWREMGAGMAATIRGGTLDQFLTDEANHRPVGRLLRWGQQGGVASLIQVTEAMSRRDREQRAAAGLPPRPTPLWETSDWNSHGYLDFLRVCADNDLLRVRGQQVTEAQPATAAP